MKEFKTFTSFSVSDIAEAKAFYSDTLKLGQPNEPVGTALIFQTGGDTSFMIYEKSDHAPAGYTVLNFLVDDLPADVEKLSARGVSFEQLEGTNEKGIAERDSMKAAWFRDPSGNWIGLFQGM